MKALLFFHFHQLIFQFVFLLENRAKVRISLVPGEQKSGRVPESLFSEAVWICFSGSSRGDSQNSRCALKTGFAETLPPRRETASRLQSIDFSLNIIARKTAASCKAMLAWRARRRAEWLKRQAKSKDRSRICLFRMAINFKRLLIFASRWGKAAGTRDGIRVASMPGA